MCGYNLGWDKGDAGDGSEPASSVLLMQFCEICEVHYLNVKMPTADISSHGKFNFEKLLSP